MVSGELTIARPARITLDWIFPAFCGALCLASFVTLLADSVFEGASHPLYDGVSLTYAWFASLVVFLLSFSSRIVLRIFCLLLSTFYTQRLITTFWAPDQLDYDDYVHFTKGDIEASTGYFLLCTLSILLGAVIAEFISNRTSASGHATLSKPTPLITYFAFTVPFERLSRLVLVMLLPVYLGNFAVLASGFGLTGAIQDTLNSWLAWFLGVGSALAPFILFSLIYFRGNDKILVPAKWAFALSAINAVWFSSKGFLLGLAVSAYLIMTLLGKRPFKGFFLLAGLLTAFSIFIFFPLMTMLRASLVIGSFDFEFDYFANLLDTFFFFLRRMGGYDWLNLWMSLPSDIIPPNANPISEAILHLNRLIPGEIIAQPDAVDLAKFMVLIGRGTAELTEIGGHGENMGGLATAYIFLGALGGLIYLIALTAALVLVERSSMHAMHKFMIIFCYVVLFLIGGGFVLIHGSLFWFLMLTTFVAALIRFNILGHGR